MSPRVVGLDLSLTSSGIATPDGLFRLPSKGKADDDLETRCRRIASAASSVLFHVTQVDPDLVVIEAPSLGQSRQRGTHDRSWFWGMVVHDLFAEGIPTAEVPPAARAKYATGKGNASKDAVLAAAVKRFAEHDVTGNDIADALVLMAMGADHLGSPLVEMPAAHRAALDAVRWPTVGATAGAA